MAAATLMFCATALVDGAPGGFPAADDADAALLERVVAQTTRSNLMIRATRELFAGTVSGKHQSWMTVETTVTPAGHFSWHVLDQSGSERTRGRVFRALLESEAESWRSGARDAALTPANYHFDLQPAARSGEYTLRLRPRRADARLVDGTLTVNADGYPLKLEGRLAKAPSFWVKSVTIVKYFGRFSGVALPTVVESLADLKLFGRSTLTMRYRYHEVNGHAVAHSVNAEPIQGPSAEILALHATGRRQ